MPSPFPGMDPYLEAPATWPDMHQRLIAYSSEALQPQLRPKYVARIGERIQPFSSEASYVPDVLLVAREPAPTLDLAPPLVADEPLFLSLPHEAQREPFIEIVASDSGEVVTLIEVLSPANKMGKGRAEYLQKQADLLDTAVNLVEIDLLGYGQETVLARNFRIPEPADWRYLIDVSRGDSRQALEVYAAPLRARLPRCRIPLRPPDADAVLDLPAVLARCYEVGGYDLVVDYSRPPATRLNADEAAWVEEVLQGRKE